MFYVRHHDDVLSMFNSKCQNAVLLHHMKKTLGFTGNIDLVLQAPEYKTMSLIGLQERGDITYGNTFITPRATYVLLGFTEDEDGIKEYQVLWKSKPSEESDKLVAALEGRTADERKKGGGKGKKK